MNDTRILFLHNTAMWYRIPFFRKIAQQYDLNLVFTHINVISDLYSEGAEKQVKGLEDVNYTILPNRRGFARGLIKKLLEEHDVTIGGSWDTLQELMESYVILFITKLKHEKFIIWREDWNWEKENSLKEKALDIAVKILSRNADLILVPGQLHRSYFRDNIGVKEDKIIIMPNVSNIPIKHVTPNTNTKNILYVGRLIERKGVNYLLEAYRNLSIDNKKLIIIGSGPEEEKLKRIVEDENIPDVVFTGKIDNKQLEEYYEKSNVVVIPSINKTMGDPWVFVLNEAMSYSKPVIATTAVGAAPDMIKGNGFIVEEKNSSELTDALTRILGSPELEVKMSKTSTEIMENEFKYENMLNSFNEAVKKVKK